MPEWTEYDFGCDFKEILGSLSYHWELVIFQLETCPRIFDGRPSSQGRTSLFSKLDDWARTLNCSTLQILSPMCRMPPRDPSLLALQSGACTVSDLEGRFKEPRATTDLRFKHLQQDKKFAEMVRLADYLNFLDWRCMARVLKREQEDATNCLLASFKAGTINADVVDVDILVNSIDLMLGPDHPTAPGYLAVSSLIVLGIAGTTRQHAKTAMRALIKALPQKGPVDACSAWLEESQRKHAMSAEVSTVGFQMLMKYPHDPPRILEAVTFLLTFGSFPTAYVEYNGSILSWRVSPVANFLAKLLDKQFYYPVFEIAKQAVISMCSGWKGAAVGISTSADEKVETCGRESGLILARTKQIARQRGPRVYSSPPAAFCFDVVAIGDSHHCVTVERDWTGQDEARRQMRLARKCAPFTAAAVPMPFVSDPESDTEELDLDSAETQDDICQIFVHFMLKAACQCAKASRAKDIALGLLCEQQHVLCQDLGWFSKILLTHGGVKEHNLAAELLAKPPNENFGATLARRVVAALSDITVSPQAKLKLADALSQSRVSDRAMLHLGPHLQNSNNACDRNLAAKLLMTCESVATEHLVGQFLTAIYDNAALEKVTRINLAETLFRPGKISIRDEPRGSRVIERLTEEAASFLRDKLRDREGNDDLEVASKIVEAAKRSA